MAKKEMEEAQADMRAISKYSQEILMQVALVVPVEGDPANNYEEVIWGLPVLFWGPPGIGKSARAKKAAARLGLSCEVIFPSTLQPEDVTGVLVPDGHGSAHKMSNLDAVNRLCAKGRGVLFIDELTGARAATQGALLGAVQDRQFGDMKLPNAVRIISAANPPEDAAGGNELQAPMANRFAHFDMTPPTADEWVSYLLGQTAPRTQSILDYEEQVVQNWPKAWARAQGLFAGFASKTQGAHMYKLPHEGSPQRGKAWPSPRTWEQACRAAATCLALANVLKDHEGIMLDFVASCIGPGAAGEFSTWVHQANLPDPEDVLQNGWVPDTRRLDRNYAVYTALVAYVIGTRDEPKRLSYAAKAFDILGTAHTAGLLDLIIPGVQQLVNQGLSSAMMKSNDPAKKRVGEAAHRVLKNLVQTSLGDLATEA